MVRSDKHNALDRSMFEGLVNAAEQVAGDASVRAVVLHGEGKSFCSGLDVASFMSGEGGTGVLLAREEGRLANLAQRVAYDWSLVPAPVIAAITAIASAAVSRSRSVPISGSARRTRSCPSWRSSGPRSRHGHHADFAAARSDRRREGVDVQRPHRLRERGFGARARHEDRRGSALCGAGPRGGDRAEIAGRGARREAPLRRNVGQ